MARERRHRRGIRERVWDGEKQEEEEGKRKREKRRRGNRVERLH